MKEIIHTVEIGASPTKVYDALATEKGLAGWWTKKARVDGDLIHFTFEGTFNPVLRVDQSESAKLVAWSYVSGAEPWTGSTIRFEMAEQDGKTGLLFRHRYGQDLPDEMFGVFNFNWAHYLDSLRLLCETGTGAPFGAKA
ncbi:MAG: SRPBCC family protein [Actinomycetota bacterium]